MQVHLFGVWRIYKCTCLEFGEYASALVWSLENMQVHLFGEYAHAFVWRICKCILELISLVLLVIMHEVVKAEYKIMTE